MLSQMVISDSRANGLTQITGKNAGVLCRIMNMSVQGKQGLPLFNDFSDRIAPCVNQFAVFSSGNIATGMVRRSMGNKYELIAGNVKR